MKILFFLMVAASCWAVTDEHHHASMMIHGMYGTYPMERDATGTSWAPTSTQMPGIHRSPDQWLLMVHGFLMAIYDDQGGPLGESKFFSENMFMFTAHFVSSDIKPAYGGTPLSYMAFLRIELKDKKK